MQHARRTAPILALLAAATTTAFGQATTAGACSNVAATASLEAGQPGVMWPASGETLRVGGDLFSTTTKSGDNYRAGVALIDTPLPDGYPAPTPPGAIDLKGYPTVRRAQVSGATNPDVGQGSAFWPLFQHIQRHDIAMTSPVEMDYPALDRNEATPRETDWTMSFLYRTREMNKTGTEGNVVVADVPPVTMLAIGYTGSYSVGKVNLEVEKLYQWLDTHPEYRPVGSPRAMFYNGPSTTPIQRWAEVQLPVERVEPTGEMAGEKAQSSN